MFRFIQFIIVLVITISALFGINLNYKGNQSSSTTDTTITSSQDEESSNTTGLEESISNDTTNNEDNSSIISSSIVTSSDVTTSNSSSSSSGNSSSSSVNLPIMDLLILSGHADLSIDPGAVSEGRYEYAYALEYVDLLSKYIKANYKHINVILEDAPYKVDKEVEYINKIKPDYVISIHFNAGGGTGLEIITPLENNNLVVANSIVSLMKQNNLPTRSIPIYSRSLTTNKIARTTVNPVSGTNYYGVINMGSQLGILSEIIELEFIDNTTAINAYNAKISTYVEIVAQSIEKYYQEIYYQ